jgi:P27 family predicted phage terminase small subunit
MGRRGPKPEPASVKRAKGNPSRRPIGDEPVTDDSAARKIAPPAELKGMGLKKWQQLAAKLEARKLLTDLDVEAFGRYCKSVARWHEMQARIDKEGLTHHVVSKHGEWDRPHPLLAPADRLEVRLQAFEDRFGLNPAERQRIFAARAAAPAGDLFGPRPADPQPAPPPAEGKGPIGLLN